MRLQVNSQDVVHESLDGEVVIVNLQNGSYYSLAGSGSEIWEAVVGEIDTELLVAQLQARYAEPEVSIETTVLSFVQRLLAEQLVVEAPPETGSDRPELPGPLSSGPVFPLPVLAKHVDMEGLLLLDPIHEVSEQGWPELKVG